MMFSMKLLFLTTLVISLSTVVMGTNPCTNNYPEEKECNEENVYGCIYFKGKCESPTSSVGVNPDPDFSKCPGKSKTACSWQPTVFGRKFNRWLKPGRLGGGRYKIGNACAIQMRKYEKAKNICESLSGSRLCSAKELREGAFRGYDARGCNMGKKRVWTSSECSESNENNGRYIVRKDGRGRKVCRTTGEDEKRPGAYVSCCRSRSKK